MITYSIIQKSKLEGSHRLDAEYYQPEYLELDKKIKRFENYLLGNLIISFASGKNLPQADFCNSNIFFIRTQNVRPVLIDKDGMTCVDTYVKKYPSLKEGDILTVRVGEGVGNTSIATPEFEGHSYSDNVIRFRIKNIDPYFLIVFLNSKYGYDYLERVSKGSARPLISSENIHSIRVPNLGKEVAKFCKEQILEATTEIQKSESLYSQAENLLLEELGLKNYKIDEELSCVVNFSEAKSVRRIDAEYFQPKYEKIISKIKKQKAKMLGDLVSLKKGIEPGADEYQNEGKLFIRVSNLSKQGLVDKDQKYLSDTLYNEIRKNYEPKQNEILLTKDATPGIAYVLKEPVEGIIAGGIVRLKVKEDIEPEYIALCINSLIGQMQIERDAGGSIIVHLKPEQIKSLKIPILIKSVQQKIADLVHKSHESHKKAKELLSEAKMKVEKNIGM